MTYSYRLGQTDTGICVSLKVPTPEPVTRPAANAQELIYAPLSYKNQATWCRDASAHRRQSRARFTS
jgi:hypothetical protein